MPVTRTKKISHIENMLLEGLNDEQIAVVKSYWGAYLVVAVAGSGKTTALVRRIAYLIRVRGVDPSKILAVTFSRKAAEEMNERLKALGIYQCRVGTWHSLCWEILREERPEYREWEVDVKNRFRQVVKVILGYKGMNWENADLSSVLSYIGLAKANCAEAGTDEAQLVAQSIHNAEPCAANNPQLLSQAYFLAQEESDNRGLLTFDDMLLLVWRLFKDDEDALHRWSSRFSFLLQDECLVGDTPILIDHNGRTKTIKEIVDTKWDGNILSYDEKSQKTVRQKVIGWSRKPINKPMVRIKTRRIGYKQNGERLSTITEQVKFSQRFVVCTIDHKIFTDKGWISAGLLEPGDCVIHESSSNLDRKYQNKYKIGDKGRSVLASIMVRKNETGACGNSKITNMNGPPIRGGNGRGPSQSEEALLQRLGSGWMYNYIVKTGAKGRYGVRSYKIDIANPKKMIAIELDGSSHQNRERQNQDRRKQEILEQLGWNVIRVTNKESYSLDISDITNNCPVLAEVISVDAWAPKEPWVYDITVGHTHCMYADGLLVHNCQDQNLIQSEIATFLAGDHGNYLVCGDTAQSIYQFRGSVPEKLLAFEKEWNATVIRMHRNYRSGKEIVSTANSVISNMDPSTHLGIEMHAERNIEAKVTTSCYENMDEEGESIVKEMMLLHESGVAWKEMACLFRVNAQSRGLEESLITNKVPYIVLGGINFYDRAEVKDLLSYFRVAVGRASDDDFKRCLNTPFRYLGVAFLNKVVGTRSSVETYQDAVRRVANEGVRIQQRQKTTAFEWAAFIDSIARSVEICNKSDVLVSEHAPNIILSKLIKDTNFIKYLERNEGSEAVENNKVSNVRELVRASGRFSRVEEFLDYIDDTIRLSKMSQGDRGIDRVTLCSIHKSKGLEFPTVFLIGANEKIIPHAKTKDMGEERRLFYVAVTRAERNLYISYVKQANYRGYLSPSRFIEEANLSLEE